MVSPANNNPNNLGLYVWNACRDYSCKDCAHEAFYYFFFMKRAIVSRVIGITLSLLMMMPTGIQAQSSSANYTVEGDTLNAAGNNTGNSTNYGIVDTTGEVGGDGALASANYGIADGFLSAEGLPTISSVYLSNSANALTDGYPAGVINDLSAGSTIVRHINGVVRHESGREAITTVSTVFYRSGVSGAQGCVANNNNCLRVGSCTLANTSDLKEKAYDCSITVPYYVDATDASSSYAAQNWVVSVSVTDGSTTVSDHSTTKEMGTLLALGIPNFIALGEHALGNETTAGTNVGYTLTQEGNGQADVEVSMADDMTCTIGSIPKANIQWSLADVAYGGSGTNALSATGSDTNVGVVRQTSSTPTTGALYWNLRTPSSGLAGNCNGTTIITTIAG